MIHSDFQDHHLNSRFAALARYCHVDQHCDHNQNSGCEKDYEEDVESRISEALSALIIRESAGGSAFAGRAERTTVK